jgi:hypothetical protein
MPERPYGFPKTLLQMECACCGQPSESVERRRMRTEYVDDESNFIVCCQRCFDDDVVPYWDAMWDEYYRGLL